MTIKYTEDHEYIRVDGAVGIVGITNYAQDQLGDIVFVELPQIGKALKQGEEAAVVESVKAASEIYAPVSGTVTAVNETLGSEPGLVNSDSEGAGWMFKLRLSAPGEVDGLMDEAAYAAFAK
jgi:glycine cleavage system H protein